MHEKAGHRFIIILIAATGLYVQGYKGKARKSSFVYGEEERSIEDEKITLFFERAQSGFSIAAVS